MTRLCIHDWIKFLGTAQQLKETDPTPVKIRPVTKYEYGANVAEDSPEARDWLTKHGIAFVPFDPFARPE